MNESGATSKIGDPMIAWSQVNQYGANFEIRGLAFEIPGGGFRKISTKSTIFEEKSTDFEKWARIGHEKHILSNLYNNWDLDVVFKDEEWSIYLSGFLYSEEYENINKRMAREGVSGKDIVSTILDQPQICPTVSLDPQRIADWCCIALERAQVTSIQVIEYAYKST